MSWLNLVIILGPVGLLPLWWLIEGIYEQHNYRRQRQRRMVIVANRMHFRKLKAMDDMRRLAREYRR
ncbi:hypothetical protein ABH920_005700 [Catenulispora sp. EB89]|uniref:hypothetical protein n=1 Tax=Catenulispora sp. EB89 TaxID=3156257 RepID=UPI0035190192